LSFVPTNLFILQGTWQFMSTRLPMRPEKVHGLCDDLESFWFVFLFEALHFVKHTKPIGIKMTTLFDHVDVCLTTGNHTGGVGKYALYASDMDIMTNTLKFESEPFNALVRNMYLRFKTLSAYYTALDSREKPSSSLLENFRKLGSCADITKLFEEALSSEGWPENCEKVEDQYPLIRHLTPKQKDTVASSYVNRSLLPSNESLKRKREEEEDAQVPETKRPKTGPPLWERIWSKCAFFVRG